MIRLVLFSFLFALLASCGVKKQTCTPLIVNTTQIEMVQVNEANSMFVYFISSGKMQGTRIFINRMGEAEKMTNMTMSNPDDPMQCLPVSQEKWTWNQTLSDDGQQISMQGTATMACEGKNYCIEFSYSGPLMKTVGTTVPEK